MARRTFADIKGEVQRNAQPERPEGSCFAWGCPLRGSILAGDRRCFIHDSHPHLDLQALTRGIAARRKLFEAAADIVTNVHQVAWWTEIPGRFARPFRELDREDLMPTAHERELTVTGWYRRVMNQLEAEVLADVGIQVKRGAARKERRSYAPTEDDIAAARAAEQAIADGTWQKPADAIAEAA